MPAGVKEGDRVQVIFVPSRSSQGESRVLAANALVFEAGERAKNSGSGQITVVVDAAAAPEIVAAASAGEVAVAELPGAR
jgi:hypothetical protein